MLPNTSAASVEGTPSLLTAQPSGVALPILLYISSLPRVTTVVEQSKKKSTGSAGTVQAIGLEPSIALRAYVGTMIASEFVQEKPIKPWSDAILA